MQYKTTKEKEFDELYQTYRNDVYKISLYYTKDEHIAEDMTQNIFFQIYSHFENVRMDTVRPYLVRITRNICFNWLREHKKDPSEYIDNVPEEGMLKSSLEEEYIKEEQENEEHSFIARIMEELREENESWYHILHLIYCLEKSHEDVCDELDLTRDVLYSKLYRAKRWIRKKYEKEYMEL